MTNDFNILDFTSDPNIFDVSILYFWNVVLNKLVNHFNIKFYRLISFISDQHSTLSKIQMWLMYTYEFFKCTHQMITIFPIIPKYSASTSSESNNLSVEQIFFSSVVLLHSDLLGHLGELQQQKDFFFGWERCQRNWRRRDQRLEVLDGKDQEMGKTVRTGKVRLGYFRFGLLG